MQAVPTHDDSDEEEIASRDDNHTLTRATAIFALCASTNSVSLGYDIGVSTEVGRLLEEDSTLGLTAGQREIFTGAINFFAIFGALFAQYCTNTHGRRVTFLVASIGFILGIVIQAASNSFLFLLIGRAFVGVGVGTGLTIDPLYIAELTPPALRGELVAWSEIFNNVGVVLGFSSGLFLDMILGRMGESSTDHESDDTKWRSMLLLGGMLPLTVIILVLKVMPESPRWLVAQGRSDEAQQVLSKTYPPGYDTKKVVSEIQQELNRNKSSISWKEVLMCRTSPAIRRMLWVGVGTAVAQQIVGIDAIQYYLEDVIKESGIAKTQHQQGMILVGLGILKLLFVVVGGKQFDSRGRRPLLFASLIGIILSLLLISGSFYASSEESNSAASSSSSGEIVIFGLALYLASFSIGMGPGAWLIPSEVFSNDFRDLGMSISGFCNRIGATVMSSTFLSLATWMGWASFFFSLAVASALVLVGLYIYLPETAGKSLEEMSSYFAQITNDQSILSTTHDRNDHEALTANNTKDSEKKCADASAIELSVRQID